MPTGVLEKLFDSTARIKIIRLFLLNSDTLFAPKDISRRCKVLPVVARREISLLKKIDFIKQKTESIDDLIKLKNGKIKNKKKKIQGLRLNGFFPFLRPLKNLVLNAAPIDRTKILKSFKSAGRMKLIILSGIFIQSDESRVDLLLVGDAIKKGILERILRNMEAEIGKELSYSVFGTKDFLYRFGMYDRFVHDILDYPHEEILNRLDI
ncbi:MAG TPA: hypothetical protein ENG99_00850 [bacterium]|nr:hypothetical protein [bacterium]